MTPAERSSRIVHLLDAGKKTFCGIKFKRQRFMNNVATFRELVDCEKCLKAKRGRVLAGIEDPLPTLRRVDESLAAQAYAQTGEILK